MFKCRQFCRGWAWHILHGEHVRIAVTTFTIFITFCLLSTDPSHVVVDGYCLLIADVSVVGR